MPILLAQIPQPTPDAFGQWVIAAAGVLAIALMIKQLFWPDGRETYVTKSEFKDLSEYTHNSVHELRNSLQVITNQVSILQVEVRSLGSLGDRILTRTESNTSEIKQALTILEREFPYPGHRRDLIVPKEGE